MALDKTIGGTVKMDESLSRKTFVISNEVDCAVDTVPADGIVKLINLPGDYMVLAVRTQVLTEEGSALDIDVGDGTTVDKYGDALDGDDDTEDNLYTTVGVSSDAAVLQVMFKDNNADDANVPDTVKVKVTAVLVELD